MYWGIPLGKEKWYDRNRQVYYMKTARKGGIKKGATKPQNERLWFKLTQKKLETVACASIIVALWLKSKKLLMLGKIVFIFPTISIKINENSSGHVH